MLNALKPASKGTRVDHMDAIVPGFGVRVTDRAGDKGRAASRTFILLARFPGATIDPKTGAAFPTRRALGEVGELTLDQAREKARAWLALIKQGIDPKQAEAERRAAEQRRRANTFGAVAEDFFAEHLKGQRRAKVSEREIRKDLVARWADRPITSIGKGDVLAVVQAIKARGAQRQAHTLFAHARVIFGWAIDKDVYGLEHNPCDRISAKTAIGRKNSRKRTLVDDELRLVWRAAKQLGYPYGPLYHLLLLTGQRRAEVGEARWREFDLTARLWTIPPERFKSDTPHLVPVSDDALAILQELPRFERGDYLFSTTFGAKPVGGFSKAKERLDTLVGRELEPWVNQDLRRTVRSRLPALGVADHVAELVIGHTRKGIQATYDHYKYLDERRAALTGWAGRLRLIVDPPAANVVPLRA
jgi:integrase